MSRESAEEAAIEAKRMLEDPVRRSRLADHLASAMACASCGHDYFDHAKATAPCDVEGCPCPDWRQRK